MFFRAALIFLPLAAWAQTSATRRSTPTPPPGVDEALRARVAEFFDRHVDGNFMKAFELVAADTKEYYFATQKNKFTTYQIGDIEYTKDFTRATVHSSAERIVRLRPDFPEAKITVPVDSFWKIEDGLWKWYFDPSAIPPTPMAGGPGGIAVFNPSRPAASRDAQKPPAVNQTEMDKRGVEILQQSRIDKPDIALAAGKESSAEVVFHNGQTGEVRIFVDPGPTLEGFTASAEKTAVSAGDDARIKLHYEPGKTPPPQEVRVRVIVEPFEATYSFVVRFTR